MLLIKKIPREKYIILTIPHFVVSLLAGILFILGANYSQGSDGSTTSLYYIPAIVLSVLHFVCTALTLIIWIFARGSGQYDFPQSNVCITFCYFCLVIISFLWGIVGGILTGNAGLCKNRKTCIYAVNGNQNYAVAISIIVLHVINIILAIIIFASKMEKKIAKVIPKALQSNNTQDSSTYNPWKKLGPASTISSERRTTKEFDMQHKTLEGYGRTYPQVRPPPSSARERNAMDDMFVGNRVRGNRLQPIGNRSHVDDSALNSSSTVVDQPILKPLRQKNKKTNKSRPKEKMAGRMDTSYNTVDERYESPTSRSNKGNDDDVYQVHAAYRMHSSSTGTRPVM